MKLNVSAVLAKEAERKAEPKPLPVVKVNPSVVAKKVIQEVLEKSDLINEMEMERTRLLKQRAILSSKTASLVQEVAVKFRTESVGLEKEFMCGNLPSTELAAHYKSIEALTRQGAVLYDKIEHVKRYGKLPEAETAQLNFAGISDDAKIISHDIRILDKFISKTNSKLKKSQGIKAPKNSDRINVWRDKVAIAEAQRTELKQKLNRTQYDSR